MQSHSKTEHVPELPINRREPDRIVETARDQPFFIVCCGRSGSSLLSRMLNCHPRLAVPEESHLFRIFSPWLKYYGDLTSPETQARLIDDMLSTFHIRHWVPRVDRDEVISEIRTPDFGGIVAAILQTWANSQNKARWGEKTPQHLFYWREILHYFPKVRLLHIVRDGRDVALSFMQAQFGPKTVYSAAKRWMFELEQLTELKQTIPPQQFHEIRYEDLLDAPEEVLTTVCEFLGETFTPDMLNFYEKRTSDYVEDVNAVNLKRPLLRNNKEKWRTQMNASELRVFEAVAKNTLIDYGYQPVSDPSPALSKMEELYHRFVASPPRKLIAMLKHRNGQAYELSRLRILMRLVLIDQFL